MIPGPAKISYEEVTWEHVPELKEATQHFETIWPSKSGLTGRLSQTGEPYVVITAGGLKEEGRQFPIWCSNVAIAVNLWRRAIYNYADGKDGILYWRDQPSLCTWVIEGEEETTLLYTIYSRLLISIEPEIQAA